jgi:hypothetical protein
MPFDNIKYLPSLLPCTLQMGKTNTAWPATLLRKEDNTLWVTLKMQDEPIPLCQFLGTYRTLRAPMVPMGTFDEMLEYITIPPHKESLATMLRTFPPDQIRRLPYPPQPLLVETNAAANSNAILSVASTQAILARLKAKNAELQDHFDLLTEAVTVKEHNRFIEGSIRQLAAKLEE